MVEEVLGDLNFLEGDYGGFNWLKIYYTLLFWLSNVELLEGIKISLSSPKFLSSGSFSILFS